MAVIIGVSVLVISSLVMILYFNYLTRQGKEKIMQESYQGYNVPGSKKRNSKKA